METVTNRPTLIVLCGLPFSGKTSYAQQFAFDHSTTIIGRDLILEGIQNDPALQTAIASRAHAIQDPVSRLFPTTLENARNDLLTAEYVKRVTEQVLLAKTPSVMVDGTHLHALSRSFLSSFPTWRKIAISFPNDPQVCIERLRLTSPVGIRRTITPELIEQMSGVFEVPTLAEGFDEIFAFPNLF